MLNDVACQNVLTKDDTAHRPGVAGRKGKAQGITGMKQPCLRCINPVPVGSLTRFQQKMDRCTRRTLA